MDLIVKDGCDFDYKHTSPSLVYIVIIKFYSEINQYGLSNIELFMGYNEVLIYFSFVFWEVCNTLKTFLQ